MVSAAIRRYPGGLSAAEHAGQPPVESCDARSSTVTVLRDPLFVGRYIKDVKNGPSPDWLQRRLKSIGLRPISTLVDITNLVTFDGTKTPKGDKYGAGTRLPGDSLRASD